MNKPNCEPSAVVSIPLEGSMVVVIVVVVPKMLLVVCIVIDCLQASLAQLVRA